MKLIYETPEIELNEYKFADVLYDDGTQTGGLVTLSDESHENIPGQGMDDPFD